VIIHFKQSLEEKLFSAVTGCISLYQYLSFIGLLLKMVLRNVGTVLALLVFCTLNSKNKLIY